MNLDELQSLWAAQSRQLDQALQLNWQLLRRDHVDRVQAALRRYQAWRAGELALLVPLAWLLGWFVRANSAAPELWLPAALLAAVYFGAAAATVWQFELLHRIDFGAPVADIQRRLEHVKQQGLRISRFLLLQFPLYPAYLIVGMRVAFGANLVHALPTAYLLSNLAFALLLAWPVVWFFRTVHYRNSSRPLVRTLLRLCGGAELQAAAEQLRRLDAFSAEAAPGAAPADR